MTILPNLTFSGKCARTAVRSFCYFLLLGTYACQGRRARAVRAPMTMPCLLCISVCLCVLCYCCVCIYLLLYLCCCVCLSLYVCGCGVVCGSGCYVCMYYLLRLYYLGHRIFDLGQPHVPYLLYYWMCVCILYSLYVYVLCLLCMLFLCVYVCMYMCCCVCIYRSLLLVCYLCYTNTYTHILYSSVYVCVLIMTKCLFIVLFVSM